MRNSGSSKILNHQLPFIMKIKKSFHRFLLAGWFATSLPVLAQVTNLGIAPAGNQSVLYWPVTNANYILQSTTNLASPVWVTANDALAVTASTVTNGLPQRFFRLLYTNPPAGMALIPAGLFTMGDTLDGEADAVPTNIYVSAFYMDTNLVSSNLWSQVYTYAQGQGYGFVNIGSGKGTNYPIQGLDWYDCVKWCNARSQQAGLTPVYYADAGLTQVYKTGETIPYANWTANGYRLPTEAEWEKAARGGLVGQRFPWGNKISGYQANYAGNPSTYAYDLGPNGANPFAGSGGTTQLGKFDANGYGLYDMAGNLYQWCWDWYGTPYGQPTTSNPTGLTTGTIDTWRVARGGEFAVNAPTVRCAYRGSLPPNENVKSVLAYFGFRCVRGL